MTPARIAEPSAYELLCEENQWWADEFDVSSRVYVFPIVKDTGESNLKNIQSPV
jgi:hypothetical protein